MDQVDDLKLIKKHYGEEMAHLCRRLFPTILEHKGILFQILSDTFAFNKDLGYDISLMDCEDDFKSYIHNLYNELYGNTIGKIEDVVEDPFELMKKAGYTLYECNSEKDIQSFRKYYKRDDGAVLPEYVEGSIPPRRDGEELCTFDGGRLNRCFVFFAVKDNADEIKREDFDNPRRQDEYGTSVISIQFSKGEFNDISIKNRYNHTVDNPDSTFSNDLENIIAGLTDAFIKKYNLNINTNVNHGFELIGYVLAQGKYYKYNLEKNNVYFCPDNVIIDNYKVKQYDKEKYIVFDGFILDLVNKKIEEYPIDSYANLGVYSCLPDVLGPIEKIDIKVDKQTKNKTITINDKSVIVLNKHNCILSFANNEVEKIGDHFLSDSKKIESIEINNVKEIGKRFCAGARLLNKLSLPNVRLIGDFFLFDNKALQEINLPKVEEIGKYFILSNGLIHTIDAPNLSAVGRNFLANARLNISINLPSLSVMGSESLQSVTQNKIFLPSLTKFGFYCFDAAEVSDYYFPQLIEVPEFFLFRNKSIHSFSAPLAIKIGSNAFSRCYNLENIDLRNVSEVGKAVLSSCGDIKCVVIKTYDAFWKLAYNDSVELEKLVIVEEEEKKNEGTKSR